MKTAIDSRVIRLQEFSAYRPLLDKEGADGRVNKGRGEGTLDALRARITERIVEGIMSLGL